jgi:predicted DCC family thiol-disulfide oxidoreductase YuxK
LVKAIDRRERLDIAGFSDPFRRELLTGMSDDRLNEGMHVVSVDGSIATAGDGAIALLQQLPVPLRWIGNAAKRFTWLARTIRSIYRFTARHRRNIGRVLPSVETVRRVRL